MKKALICLILVITAVIIFLGITFKSQYISSKKKAEEYNEYVINLLQE